MTAAKVLDVISRLRGFAGQASDAVSAYTQVNMKDATELLGLPESGCPAFWIRRPRPRRPNPWDKSQEPVVPLERNFLRTLFTKIALSTTIRKGLDRK